MSVSGSAAKRRLRRGRAGQVRRYTSGTTSGVGCHLGSSEALRPELHVVLSHPGLANANVTAPILQIPASTELDLRETASASLRASVQLMRAASSRHLRLRPLKTSAKKEMRRRHLLNHVQKPVNSGLLPEGLVSKEPHVFQGFRASGRPRPYD